MNEYPPATTLHKSIHTTINKYPEADQRPLHRGP